MDHVLRRIFGRLAVQVALGCMLALLFVGIVAIIRMNDVLRENEESRVRSTLVRSRDELTVQLHVYQDFLLLQTVAAAQLDRLREAAATDDPDLAVEEARESFASIEETLRRPTHVTLFNAAGSPLAGALADDDGVTPPVVTHVLATGEPVGAVRIDEVLGPVLGASVPVRSTSGDVLGVLDLAFGIDGGLIAEYVAIVGVSVVFVVDGETSVTTEPHLFDDLVWPVDEIGVREIQTPAGVYLAESYTVSGLGGAPVGTFYLGVSEEVVTAGTAAARLDLLRVTGVAVLVGMFLTFGMAWLTTRPVRDLVAGARRIQNNELDRPVSISGAGEFRVLAEAMEDMRVAIRQSRESLLSQNQELASRIDLSTSNLADATNELVTVQQLLARLEEAPSGDLSGVAAALADLVWVDGVVIALRGTDGALRVVASTRLAPGATVDLVDVINLQLSRDPFAERWYVPASLAEPRASRLASRRIGGFAVELMRISGEVAGFAAVTAMQRLTLTSQREAVLRTVAREVSLNLERRELESEVEENRRIAESVLEEMSDGVLVLDDTGVCRICNPAAARMLEHEQGEIVGGLAADYLPLDQDVLDAMSERTIEFPDRATAPVVTVQNGIRIAITASRYPDADTGRDGIILLLRDLSAEAEVERVRRDFVSIVGHELRTPLTLIRTSVDLLNEGDAGDLNDTQERLVHVLRNNAERMTRLINDLVDMSVLDPDRLEIRTTPVDIGDIVLEVIESLQADADARGHTLVARVPEESMTMMDQNRIRQVLTNLVTNAIKYTPEGGAITVSVEADEEEVEVSVADTGIGITAEEQVLLFERFYRAPGGRRMSNGTGLGLPIAKAIVELHGGTMRCESDGESGSTFIFTLPREPVGSD